MSLATDLAIDLAAEKEALVSKLLEFERRLITAVNLSCSCGGKGPKDGCCQACEVWHRFKGEMRCQL